MLNFAQLKFLLTGLTLLNCNSNETRNISPVQSHVRNILLLAIKTLLSYNKISRKRKYNFLNFQKILKIRVNFALKSAT